MEEPGPIPTGWTLETRVKKNGSKETLYCCDNGQHFDTYFGLMRYVEYAKGAKLGIYEPASKSVKGKRRKKNDSTVAVKESRKTYSILSLPGRRPSNSNSSDTDSYSEDDDWDDSESVSSEVAESWSQKTICQPSK